MKRVASVAVFLTVLLLFVLAGLLFAQWGTPVQLSSSINTSQFSEEDPFITADGQMLFFVSSRVGSLDIWFSKWDSTRSDWGVPVRLPPSINSGVNDDYSPSVSPDGMKLYFQSFGGGFGGWDVWVALWDSVNNQWGTPENLGPNVNYIYTEWSPKISADGKKLYYQSGGRGHPQGTAIFTSVYDDALGWQFPVPFPDWINNTATEEGPYVSSDGKDLFFVKWLVGGPGGIRKIFWSHWQDTNWSIPVMMDTTTINRGHSWSPFLGPDGRLYYAGTGGGGSVDIWVVARIPTGLDDPKGSGLPRDFELYQNYPNPFNASTTIRFRLHQHQETVIVSIYNLAGEIVKQYRLFNPKAGEHLITWEGSDNRGRKVASGIYLYTLEADGQKLVKKMVFLK